MKTVLFVCFLMGSMIGLHAQGVNVSTIKIGPLSLGMKLTDAEKAIGTKFNIKEVKQSYENYKSTIKQLVQGVVVEIGFYEEYNEDDKAPKTYTIDRLKSYDSKLKTKSGIGIGMSKAAVMDILDKQNIAYHYSKSPTYDDEGKPTTILVESLTISDITAEKSLILLMKNGKVVGFQLGYSTEDGC